MARILIFPTEKRRRTRPTVNPNSSAQVIEFPVLPNPFACTGLELLIAGVVEEYLWARETAKSYDWQPMPNGQRTIIGNYNVTILRDQNAWIWQIQCQDTGESQSSETPLATPLDAKMIAVKIILNDEDRPDATLDVEQIEYIAAMAEACLEAESG